MVENFTVRRQLDNLQQLIKNTSSVYDFCHNTTIDKYADVLTKEIAMNTREVDRLVNDVVADKVSTEMACIDLNYFMDEATWMDVPKVFDAQAYQSEEAYLSLRDAMQELLHKLEDLNSRLKYSSPQWYMQFHDLCLLRTVAQRAKRDYESWKADNDIDENAMQEFKDKRQQEIYRFYESGFMRYEPYTKRKLQVGQDFAFDFDALPEEAVKSKETDQFCAQLSRYMRIQGSAMELTTAKMGRYLFVNYTKLNAKDHCALTYFEVMMEMLQKDLQRFKEVEQENEQVKSVLLGAEAMVCWKKLQRKGYFDEKLKPTEKLTNTQLVIIADELCARLDMKPKWAFFEWLWDKKNLRIYNNKALNQENSYKIRKDIQKVLDE